MTHLPYRHLSSYIYNLCNDFVVDLVCSSLLSFSLPTTMMKEGKELKNGSKSLLFHEPAAGLLVMQQVLPTLQYITCTSLRKWGNSKWTSILAVLQTFIPQCLYLLPKWIRFTYVTGCKVYSINSIIVRQTIKFEDNVAVHFLAGLYKVFILSTVHTQDNTSIKIETYFSAKMLK